MVYFGLLQWNLGVGLFLWYLWVAVENSFDDARGIYAGRKEKNVAILSLKWM